MFAWLADLFKHLDIPARIAWMAFLFGSAALLLSRHAFWPFVGVEKQLTLSFGIAALLGATVLLVKFGGWLVETSKAKYVSSRDERRASGAALAASADAAAAEQAKAASHRKELDANLMSLTPLEYAQLIWIFRRGHQRVDLQHLQYGLIKKQIVYPVTPHSRYHVDVDDYVWGKRDSWVEASKKYPDSAKFPIVEGIQMLPWWSSIRQELAERPVSS